MSEHDPYIRYTHRFFGRWAGVYDLFAGSILYAYRAAVRAIGPHPGMSLLDLCTGTGELALRCAARGAAVTGIDITPAMLDRARAKAERRGLSWRTELMDARHLAFPDGGFDVVSISFALHDMPREVRLRVLREAVRVCGGRLVVLDYELPRGTWLFKPWFWIIASFESPFFRNFVKEDPVRLFAEAGLPAATRRRLFGAMFSVFEFGIGGPRDGAGTAGDAMRADARL